MRGRIVFVNPETLTGLIFGSDSKRYNFQLTEWSQSSPPGRNLEVSFQAKGLQAFAIQPFSSGLNEDLPQVDAPRPPVKASGGKAPQAPDLSTAQDVSFEQTEIDPLFNDGIALPAGIEGQQAPLTAKRGWGGPRKLDSRVLLEEGVQKVRPAWHYYLIGIGAFFVLLVIAYLIRLVLG